MDKLLYEKLYAKVEHIHFSCFELCKQALGKYLPVAGNVGIFCQSEQEFELLTKLREEITEPLDNPNQKYYLLYKPIVIPAKEDVPKTSYTYLYIRKLDPTPYGRYVGDIDFVLKDSDYANLKESLKNGAVIKGAEIYNRPGWDMIQLSVPEIDCVAYVGTDAMTQKVRVRF